MVCTRDFQQTMLAKLFRVDVYRFCDPVTIDYEDIARGEILSYEETDRYLQRCNERRREFERWASFFLGLFAVTILS